MISWITSSGRINKDMALWGEIGETYRLVMRDKEKRIRSWSRGVVFIWRKKFSFRHCLLVKFSLLFNVADDDIRILLWDLCTFLI